MHPPVAETPLAQRQLLGHIISPKSDAHAPAASHEPRQGSIVQLIQVVLLCSRIRLAWQPLELCLVCLICLPVHPLPAAVRLPVLLCLAAQLQQSPCVTSPFAWLCGAAAGWKDGHELGEA